MNKITNVNIPLALLIFFNLIFSCNTIKKISGNAKINDIVSPNNISNIFKKPEPITTNFSDTKQDNSLSNTFDTNKKAMPLSKQPRSDNGGYILAPGFYEMTSRSYCLHAGTHGPSKGDGYLYAQLKGSKKDIIQAIIRGSSSKKNIQQHTVQMLIWAVLSKTNFKNLSTDLKIVASELLDLKQLYELNGGALGFIPSSVIYKATELLPKPAKDAILLENKLRGLFEQANSSYQDFERIAVLSGKAPNGKEYTSGSWSRSPSGYYVRYFPNTYKQTKVQVYVPQNINTGFEKASNIFIYASYKGNETIEYDGANDVAVPANTGAQRLQQTNDPVDNEKNNDTPKPVIPKFDPCQDFPKEGIKDVNETNAEFETKRRLPKKQQLEKSKGAQVIQDIVRSTGVKPNKTSFNDMDEAGVTAIRYINGTSIKENNEYAGQIYLDPSTGKYYFSEPIRGESNSSDPKKSKVPNGMKVVGDYHTHGGDFKYTDEIFSFPDIINGDLGDRGVALKQNNGNSHYLGTPQGRIQKMIMPTNWNGKGPCSDTIKLLN